MKEFIYNQDKLDDMSIDIDLITKEVHEPNDYYGQANILRKYCKYPFSMKAVYEHSLPFHDIIWHVDMNSKCLIAFVSSIHRFKVYKSNKIKKIVFNIGSILNYVINDSVFEEVSKKITRSGSVYFPPHSTHHIKSNVNNLLIIDKLNNLPEKFHPISVCMYWKDVQNGNHKIYLDNGFQVISAGHIYDKMFYYRLYDILRRFNYSLGSSFGSFVFHSARSGSKVYFPEILRIKEAYEVSTKNFEDPELESRLKFVSKFEDQAISLFSDESINYSDDQIKFIEYYSSSKLYSKRKLFCILLFADFLYVFRNLAKKIIK